MTTEHDGSSALVARSMWALFEPIHAVSYFAPHTRAAFEAAGVRGFWRSYFAGRAAPLGRTGPHIVHAMFHSFTLGMVERAIPSVWDLIDPERAWSLRQASGSESIDHCLAGIGPGELGWIAETLRHVADRLDPIGRPFFAAHLDMRWPATTTASIWMACTLLREHRGDGYIAAATSNDLTPLDLMVLAESINATPAGHAIDNRGWTTNERNATRDRLTEHGLIDAAGRISAIGRRRRDAVEDTTDRLAAPAWASVSPAEVERLTEGLGTIVGQIAAHGWITYPNPVGVTPPTVR